MGLFSVLIESKWASLAYNEKKLDVEVAFVLALQLVFKLILSRIAFEFSITQICLNEKKKCDLSLKLCI